MKGCSVMVTLLSPSWWITPLSATLRHYTPTTVRYCPLLSVISRYLDDDAAAVLGDRRVKDREVGERERGRLGKQRQRDETW